MSAPVIESTTAAQHPTRRQEPRSVMIGAAGCGLRLWDPGSWHGVPPRELQLLPAAPVPPACGGHPELDRSRSYHRLGLMRVPVTGGRDAAAEVAASISRPSRPTSAA